MKVLLDAHEWQKIRTDTNAPVELPVASDDPREPLLLPIEPGVPGPSLSGLLLLRPRIEVLVFLPLLHLMLSSLRECTLLLTRLLRLPWLLLPLLLPLLPVFTSSAAAAAAAAAAFLLALLLCEAATYAAAAAADVPASHAAAAAAAAASMDVPDISSSVGSSAISS